MFLSSKVLAHSNMSMNLQKVCYYNSLSLHNVWSKGTVINYLSIKLTDFCPPPPVSKYQHWSCPPSSKYQHGLDLDCSPLNPPNAAIIYNNYLSESNLAVFVPFPVKGNSASRFLSMASARPQRRARGMKKMPPKNGKIEQKVQYLFKSDFCPLNRDDMIFFFTRIFSP